MISIFVSTSDYYVLNSPREREVALRDAWNFCCHLEVCWRFRGCDYIPDSAVVEVPWLTRTVETGRPTTLSERLLVTSQQKMTTVPCHNKPTSLTGSHQTRLVLYSFSGGGWQMSDEVERDGMSQLMLLLPVWWSVQTITMTIHQDMSPWWASSWLWCPWWYFHSWNVR